MSIRARQRRLGLRRLGLDKDVSDVLDASEALPPQRALRVFFSFSSCCSASVVLLDGATILADCVLLANSLCC
jgi:hypothetical protein